jgi:hypothetical protein
LCDDALAGYLRRYQTMVAARHQDAAPRAAVYQDSDALVWTSDGLQPEKGHQTLCVVRELQAQRVWLAEPLLSSTTVEIQRLVVKAKQGAERLGKPVRLWRSDKQEAFVQAIAAAFAQVPHRSCPNPFLRDVAKTMLQADSPATVQMRRKVRGLRTIARDSAAEPQAAAVAVTTPAQPPAAAAVVATATAPATASSPPAARAVVLDYGAAVRGIRKDDPGGPLQPPRLRMAEALREVRGSLQRNREAKQGGVRRSP